MEAMKIIPLLTTYHESLQSPAVEGVPLNTPHEKVKQMFISRLNKTKTSGIRCSKLIKIGPDVCIRDTFKFANKLI